jgi:Flp pilus assembly protein TadG
MRMIVERLRRRDDERGAVAIIVTLCLIAIFAMVVLTVDVGGLLLERRSMVNAADAAALAAAQSCAITTDTDVPEEVADTYAVDNVPDVPAAGITNITEMPGCDLGTTGHVTVQYSEQHDLFFAGVLPSQQSVGTISTTATAAWGTLGGGYAIPIVLDMGTVQGECDIPIPVGGEVPATCAFWYDDKDTMGSGNWGFIDLDEWNVAADASCPSSGTSDLKEWVENGYPELRVLNGTPPGSAPTYACIGNGHSDSTWRQTLADAEGQTKLFPVNDCTQQVDQKGAIVGCDIKPHKFDIVGFTSLLVEKVYRGNEAEAIGTPGATGTCAHDFEPFDNDGDVTTGQTIDLNSFGLHNDQCFSSAPDTIDPASLVIRPLKNTLPPYVQCAPAQTSGCNYLYEDGTVTWTGSPTQAAGTKESDDDLRISFGWQNTGVEGACGTRTSDPNAICLVTQWQGFTTAPGTVGVGPDFGTSGIKLCDLGFSVGCPDEG